MANQKEINAWDVVDGLWDFVEKGNIEKVTGMNWQESVEYIFKRRDISNFSITEGVHKFLFEKKYFFSKPDRSTMKWLWGDHVSLFDLWGCDKHMFTIKTSDSYDDMIEGQTVACPFCNEKIMSKKGFVEYFNLGKQRSWEEWKQLEKTAKWHRDWNRKENFKYRVRQLFEKGYLKYKINSFFSKLFKQA